MGVSNLLVDKNSSLVHIMYLSLISIVIIIITILINHLKTAQSLKSTFTCCKPSAISTRFAIIKANT